MMALWQNSRYLTVEDRITLMDKQNNIKETLGIRLINHDVPDGSYTYIVKSDDTLFTIALEQYGDARLWHLIADINPNISDPECLNVGSVVYIPPPKV